MAKRKRTKGVRVLVRVTGESPANYAYYVITLRWAANLQAGVNV
jgi:hypothetical protein